MPQSLLLLSLSIGLMALATFSATVLIEPLGEQDLLITLLMHILGLGFYIAVLFVARRPRRSLQVVTCVLGCGAILTFLFVAEYLLFRPFLGARMAGTIAVLIIFWSIPVEGHIMARAIDRPWFVGIVLAVAAFVLQYLVQSSLIEAPSETG